MTREGDEDIEGGLRKFFDIQEGGSVKIVGLGGGLRKFVYFKTNRKGFILSERSLTSKRSLTGTTFSQPPLILFKGNKNR